MATGMVLVIVTRNIDLSVGSMLGFVGMVIGVAAGPSCCRSSSASSIRRSGSSRWSSRPRRSARAIGCFQGLLIAYLGDSVLHRHARRPAGLARRRLVGHQRPDGRADGHDASSSSAAVPKARSAPPGAGSSASSPASASSLALSTAARQRKRFNFPLRPIWAEIVIGGRRLRRGPRRGRHRQFLSAGRPASRASYAPSRTASPWPRRRRCSSPHGIAIPVLIALGVGVVMTFLATRTRFGRYVFAIGGNPEAAELAGINTQAGSP